MLLIRRQFTVADLAGRTMPDDCLDLIVSTASLHHWTDADAVMVSLDRRYGTMAGSSPGCTLTMVPQRPCSPSSTPGQRCTTSIVFPAAVGFLPAPAPAGVHDLAIQDQIRRTLGQGTLQGSLQIGSGPRAPR